MVKLKYTGAGMLSRDITFSPTKNDGIHTVSDEDSEYFLATFPRQFELIEKVKEEDVEAEKKPRVRKTRKKNTDVAE